MRINQTLEILKNLGLTINRIAAQVGTGRGVTRYIKDSLTQKLQNTSTALNLLVNKRDATTSLKQACGKRLRQFVFLEKSEKREKRAMFGVLGKMAHKRGPFLFDIKFRLAHTFQKETG